jgi:hypothetical protein
MVKRARSRCVCTYKTPNLLSDYVFDLQARGIALSEGRVFGSQSPHECCALRAVRVDIDKTRTAAKTNLERTMMV